MKLTLVDFVIGGIQILEFKSNQTIVSQIITYLKKEIFSGRYQSGQKIHPIREFAAQMEVNPNTITKAYTVLEEERLIYTDSTLGKFVSVDKKYLNLKRQEYLENEIEMFKKGLKDCGVSEEEFICLAKKL